MRNFKVGDILKSKTRKGCVLVVEAYKKEPYYYGRFILINGMPYQDNFVETSMRIEPEQWEHLTELEKALL